MFKTRSNCAKCIDIYEKGLRSEPEFIKSLKKLNANEKKEIDKEIKVRRKAIHKKFGDIFRDEAKRMLNVVHSFDPSKSIRKTKRLAQQYRDVKKYSPTMSTKLNKYQDNMKAVLDTMDVGLSQEEIAFQEEMAGVAKAKNILKATEYKRPGRLTAKQKIAAADRNLKTYNAYMDKKKSKLTAKEKKAGIKEIARRMEDNKKPYRYSATTFDDDFKPKPKKKGIFSGLFGTKKGGRRTRKKRKRKRTRKRRKRRRRKTRK
tara:strand:+ start:309 stop:1088 length:780 start_codon:yes stop_codon:yes gene_type:complete